MAAFTSGIELSRAFYCEVVRPVLDAEFPRLEHAAAFLGTGSEVLGFDTERSRDHAWGPRLQLFVDNAGSAAESLLDVSDRVVPATFRGISVRYPYPRFSDPARLQITVADLDTFLSGVLGIDIATDAARLGAETESGAGTELTAEQWLALPTQALLEVTAGAVFHDGPGRLTRIRALLAWYPDQVWRYVLACQWMRVAQQETYVGRCAEVGDELGSAMVAARIAREIMRLCLLIDRVYPPYDKWLGSAFARLPWTDRIASALTSAIAATGHPEREAALCQAYQLVAARHNDVGLTEPLDTSIRSYHGRPFQVLDAKRFATALRASITDSELRAMPWVGAIDQLVDNGEVLANSAIRRRYLAFPREQ
jgi:hypothetical protein